MRDVQRPVTTGSPIASEVDVVATYQETPPSRLKLPFVTDPYAEMAASFRSLRHRVQSKTNTRIVAVTSPQREDGKTTCALNLAMAFAEHGVADVLLIEACVQHPAIAAGLGFSPPHCFVSQMAEALESGSAYRWRAVATYFPNLHVVAIDPTQLRPAHLNGAAFNHAMQRLAATPYQRIIVDCPQVIGSSDISIIQDCVDGLLFVGRAGITRSSEVRRAAEQLAPVNTLGMVLMQG